MADSEETVIASVNQYLAEVEFCYTATGPSISGRRRAASEGLCKCITELAQIGSPKARLAVEKIRRTRGLYANEAMAAKDALSRMPGLPCESCKSTQRQVRLWLDAPDPDQYLCDECIHSEGFDDSDANSPVPCVMPYLVDASQLRDGPGQGAAAFSVAIEAWNRGRHDEAAPKYIEALEVGLTPPYEAGARGNLGQIRLNQGRIHEALLQFKKALFASPQAPGVAYDAAIRFSIVSEELGATSQATKAQQIAKIAAASMNSALSPDAAARIRRIVRDHRGSDHLKEEEHPVLSEPQKDEERARIRAIAEQKCNDEFAAMVAAE